MNITQNQIKSYVASFVIITFVTAFCSGKNKKDNYPWPISQQSINQAKQNLELSIQKQDSFIDSLTSDQLDQENLQPTSSIWNRDFVDDLVVLQNKLLHEDKYSSKLSLDIINIGCHPEHLKEIMSLERQRNNTLSSVLYCPHVIDQINEAIALYAQEYEQYGINQFEDLNLKIVIQGKKRNQNIEYISLGNIFGDIGTLYQVVKDYIDDNLMIKDNSQHFIFLGNCPGGGPTSLLAFLLLLRLKYKNPNHITYIRGNHEASDPSEDYKSPFMPALEQLYNNGEKVLKIFRKMHDFFKYLPVALFLHDSDNENTALYSNGLFDTMYHPLNLFQSLKDSEKEDFYEFFDKGYRDSKFIKGEFIPTEEEFPINYFLGAAMNNPKISQNFINSETIINYAKQHKITNFFSANEWDASYKKLAAMYCANGFTAVFDFGPIDQNSNKAILLILQGPCHNTPSLFPKWKEGASDQQPGFAATSIIRLYKNSYNYGFFDIIMLPNKQNEHDEERVNNFAKAYAHKILSHFKEPNFPTPSHDENNNPKVKIFNYLLQSFENYLEKNNLMVEDEIPQEKLVEFLRQYTTVDQKRVIMQYGENGNQYIFS